MNIASHVCVRSSFPSRRMHGGAMIAALVIALIIAICLTSYLRLSTSSLRLSDRTFFADSAGNLAEAGLEEAVWLFNKIGSSTDAAANTTQWTTNGWTCANTVGDIYMEEMGANYVSAPVVTFSGGGGTGATAVAKIGPRQDDNGNTVQSVLGITLTNAGSGYTSAPTITLSGGGGTGAAARARFAATRTLTFNNLGPNVSGYTKIWVAGYDGTSPLPTIVSKGTVVLPDGKPVEKIVKVIMGKKGQLARPGIASKGRIDLGNADANSYVSSAVPGVPPFTQYSAGTARPNTTVGTISGPLEMHKNANISGDFASNGTTIPYPDNISGQIITPWSFEFTMPPYPVNTGTQVGVDLGSTVPAVLPRASDTVPAADGYFYYYCSNAAISGLSITAGKKVVITGINNTRITGGVQVLVTNSPPAVGTLKIYMDGNVTPGNTSINTGSWAGALQIWTTGTSIRLNGNRSICACVFAPNATIDGNGNTDWYGSFVGASFGGNGNKMSFHWDEGLSSLTGPIPWSLALWTELQSASDRAVYADRLAF